MFLKTNTTKSHINLHIAGNVHGLRTNKSCKEKFLAIKTDMSKAYDRVEWSFLQRLPLKMGFSMELVALMMQCISSVSYKVLLNGQPKGLIVPERGSRQGDSLSQYLFILCTEALIASGGCSLKS